jgi:hypothetical protein
MGAGVATSPHFPWVGRQTREGRASFPGRIRFRRSLAASSVPSRVAGAASLPGRSPSGGPVKASFSGVPVRFRPGLWAPVGSGSDHHQGQAPAIFLSRSIARRPGFAGRLWKVGSALAFAFASRFFLGSPCHSLRLAFILLGCLPLSAVAEAGSFRPFPGGGSWPRLKLAQRTDSPKRILPVDN